MKRAILLPVLFLTLFTFGQFRYDNVLFKTVDLAELCKTLEKNKDYILLDVRSPGEYADTSRFSGYNLGHLDGAINIDIRQLGPRIKEIEGHKNKPVFVYCSHSQRSRRALKMLADSGFTNLFNINGGMSAIHYRGLKKDACFPALYKTGVKYQVISIDELAARVNAKPSAVVIDVRPDSAFRHISTDAKINAVGLIRNAKNIPFEMLQAQLSSLPKDREIILTDIYGDDAAKSAQLLVDNGFTRVSALIEGMERLLISGNGDKAVASLYISPLKYAVITAPELGKRMAATNNITLLDIRSADEFANKHKDGWRNIGHIRNAIHIPENELEEKIAMIDKTKPVIVYGIGSGTEVFQAANTLYKNGITNLYVLMGGIFNLRWSSGNLKGEQQLADLVVDVPAENK